MELEAKFACKNIPEAIGKAEVLGFKFEKKQKQIDTYFIMNETKADGTRHYLRIREDVMKNKISLDYHRVLSLLETEETEMEINDKEKMFKILSLLGLGVKCVVDKERHKYTNGKIILTFDTIKGLGNFVEIEINDDISKENESLIKKTSETLGLLEENRVIKKGYPDLLIEKGGYVSNEH
jgi:adenylate cyclase, class 2